MQVLWDVTMYHCVWSFWCSEESQNLHFLHHAVWEDTWFWVQFCKKLLTWNYSMQIYSSYFSYSGILQIRHGMWTPTVSLYILHVTLHHDKYQGSVTTEAWVWS